MIRSETEVFKVCMTCNASWKSRNDFLADRNVKLIGYQPYFERLDAGLFLFNHVCRTTLAIPVAEFFSLYNGTIYDSRITGDGCPGYCLHQNELDPCPSICECAFVREIIQHIREWPNAET